MLPVHQDNGDPGSTRTSSSITLFYSNITKWGPQAKIFLVNETAKVLMLTEHHLDDSQLGLAIKEAEKWGRIAYCSGAQRNGLHVSATTGGQMILPKSFLGCAPLDPKLLHHVLPKDRLEAPRWKSCILRTKGVSILLVVVYLRTAEGLSEANLSIIRQLCTLAAFFRGQILIGGDWQMTPEMLASTPLITAMGLIVKPPIDTDATCKSGDGRIIDFFVCSAAISPYIIVNAEFNVPWKDHVGLRVSVPARLRSFFAPSRHIPRPLPSLPLTEGVHVMDQSSWHKAVEFADEYIRRKSAGAGIIGGNAATAAALHPDQAAISKQLCTAATRIEAYACFTGNVEQAMIPRYLGRGGFPHFAVKPMVSRHVKSSFYSCPSCNFWATMEANLGWLKKCFSSKVAVCMALVRLKSSADQLGNHWCRSAAPNAPVHAWVTWLRDVTYEELTEARPGFTADRVDTWINRSIAQKHRAIAAKNSKVKKSFRKWLQADLNTGAAGAHKLVAEKSWVPNDDVTSCQNIFDQWKQTWHAQHTGAKPSSLDSDLLVDWIPWKEQLPELVKSVAPNGPMQSILQTYRNQHSDNAESVIIAPEKLQEAASAYPDTKAKGTDEWSTGFLRTLPLLVLSGLSQVLTQVQIHMLWPAQIMFNLMSLLPKPQGGQRTVAKTPMLYRLWNILVTPQLKEWNEATVPDWDFATKGRSAVFSATLRAWTNEVAKLAGVSALSILWDIEKFFDTINPKDVLREGIALKYPLRCLLLALSMHMSPRSLTIRGVSSNAMVASRSILPGCTHAGYFARLVMVKPVQRVIRDASDPSMRVSTFVDDVAQQMIGVAQRVSRQSAKAAVSFCAGMASLKLKISSKTVVVASDNKLAQRIVEVIRKFPGVTVKQQQAGRDLGILNNPTGVRRTLLQASRVAKVKCRLKRISPLAKTLRRSRVLIHTGAIPQATWGSAAVGIAPTTLAKVRRHIGIASGITSTGRCLTTAIALSVGPARDPAITLPILQVDTWIQLWQSDAQLRALTARHWGDMCTQVLDQQTPVPKAVWNSVYGPAGATVAVLHDQSWDLRDPLLWKDPNGDGWIPDFSMDRKPFLDLIASFASKKLWFDASKHYLGKGLEHGVAWDASVALHKHLLAMNNSADNVVDEFMMDDLQSADGHQWHVHAISWLETFMCGGYWTQDRAATVHPVTNKCPRCGCRVAETPLHMIWTCPANQRIADQRVENTQKYISQAVEGTQQFECLWLRGLLPASLVRVNTPFVESMELHYVGDAPVGRWPPGQFFTDSSGGPFSSLPVIRRCGVGIAVLRPTNNDTSNGPLFSLQWGVFAPLEGVTQTVPRGELYAIMVVILRLDTGLSIVKTDSLVNVQTFDKGKTACLNAANCDLWKRIWDVLDDGQVKVELEWIKGHAENPEIFDRYNVQVEDLYGNLFADKLANRAAELYQVFAHDSFGIQWHYTLVRDIQARAIVILQQVLEARGVHKSVRPPKLPQISAAGEVMRSEHRCTLIGGVLQCNNCFQRSPATVAGRRGWLKSPCVADSLMVRAMYVGNTRPSPIPAGRSVKVGRAMLDPSHNLHVLKGLYFCMSCGYNASHKAQKLTKECLRASAAGHVERKLTILRGNLPSGLRHWPNEAPSGAGRGNFWLELD